MTTIETWQAKRCTRWDVYPQDVPLQRVTVERSTHVRWVVVRDEQGIERNDMILVSRENV